MKKKRRQKFNVSSADAVTPGETSHASRPGRNAGQLSFSGRQRFWFRLLALTGLPLGFLILAELVLRVAGFGDPTTFFLTSRVGDRQVYIENQRYGRLFFPPSLVRHPAPLLFDAAKPTKAFRIFIFGESAAMGDPDPSFGFGRVLEVLLRERYTGIQFEVINTAFTAINSHAIVPIARECESKAGDAWIVYMGNNEVVGPYGAGTVFSRQTPPWRIIRAGLWLKTTRLGQAMSRWSHRMLKPGTRPATWGGMEMFVEQKVKASDPRLGPVRAHFRRNLEDIMRAGERAGAAVLLCTPANNLKDCAPFASLHRDGLAEPDKAKWDAGYEEGVHLASSTNYPEALARFQKAEQEDDTYADMDYWQGKCLWALGRFDEAKRRFEKARDLDALRFRPDQALLAAIREVAGDARRGANVRLVDTERAVAQASPHQITGDELLYEHVHPTFRGNYTIALALGEQIQAAVRTKFAGVEGGKTRWLSEEEAEQRLCHTGYDQHCAVENIWKRMRKPPFTEQTDRVEREQRWQAELDRLKPQSKSYAMKRSAELYRRETDRVPADWHLRANYARLLQTSGESAAAIVQWQKVLEMVPHHPQAHHNLGALLEESGKSEAAEGHFRKAMELCPEFPEALNGLGLSLAKRGQHAQAIQYYQKAVLLAPDAVENLLNLGACWEKLGRQEEAIRWYRRVLEIDPSNGPAQQGLNQTNPARRN